MTWVIYEGDGRASLSQKEGFKFLKIYYACSVFKKWDVLDCVWVWDWSEIGVTNIQGGSFYDGSHLE